MNNTSNKKGIVIGIIILLLIVAGIVYAMKGNKSDAPVTADASVLQEVPYTDQIGKFSINLPTDWIKVDQSVTASSSDTWFGNPKALPGEEGASIVIRRFESSPAMKQLVDQLGADQFLDGIMENMRMGINKYTLVSTSTTDINGRVFRITKGTYEGAGTGRQATQLVYMHMKDDAYYLIGVDIYTDLLPKLEERLNQTIITFKFE